MTGLCLPPAIFDHLAACNGRRRERTIGSHDLESAIEELMADPDKVWVSCDGGTVAASYGYPAYSTVGLAARIDGRIYLGIGLSRCPCPSPGRVWPELQPFGIGRPETVLAKLRQWAARPDVYPIG